MARPAKYDKSTVLDSAMKLFWERGYRGVGISELVKETGMLAGSLYSCFGNKDGIYTECIHHYGKHVSAIYDKSDEEVSPLRKVEALMGYMLADSIDDELRRGCFVINALLEIAPQNEEIAKVLRYYINFSEKWIEDRLDLAKEVGELKEETDTNHLASCLFGIVYSLRIKARAQESEERLTDYQRSVTNAILDPWKVST